MKNYSYNCGKPVQKTVVPTLAETMYLIDRLKHSGQLFRVDFLKRTTGEMRTMLCRFRVKSQLKGGKPAYNFGEKGLLSVYDMNKQGYRSVPIDNIERIKHGGILYLLNTNLEARDYPYTSSRRTLPAYTSPLYEHVSTASTMPDFNNGNGYAHHQY